jgi:hypothetical protein
MGAADADSPPRSPPPPASWHRLWARAFYCGAVGLVYFVVASAVVDSFHDHWAMGDKWRKSRFNKSIHYTIPPPFAYRVLTPWLVNTVTGRLPAGARAELAATGQRLRARYDLRLGNDREYAVAHYLIFLALVGTQLAWRASVAAVGHRRLVRDFAPPVAMTLLPMTFMEGGFIYDPPELLLTGTALALFLRRRWLGFYLVFALAVLNKESNILLPIWFLAPFIQRRDWRFLLRHAALSVAVGAPPFLAVRYYFAEGSAGPMRLLLPSNLEYLATPSTYWNGFDVYAEALPAPEGFHLFNLFLLVSVLVLAWRKAELREVWLIAVLTVLALLPFFLLFGYRDEIRVFGPAFAALVVLAVGSVAGVATDPERPA